MTKDWSELKGTSIYFKVGRDHETALKDASANNFHFTTEGTLVMNGEVLSQTEEYKYAYGVEWDVTDSKPAVTRIGRDDLHRTLPVQSKMRGCIINDNGEFVEYLPDNDWTSATRDGTKGQIMVEIPEHWRKCETEGNIRRVWISAVNLPGFKHVRKTYVGAYKGALDQTSQSNKKLCSVYNTTTQFRGGWGRSSMYDDDYRSQLGHPYKYQTLNQFRSYARNRNKNTTEWNVYTYECYNNVFWLFVIEYATRNSQAAFTSELTSDGYHQGGLGDGITNLNYTKWLGWMGCDSVCPCGYTDEFGNLSGVKDILMDYKFDACPSTSINQVVLTKEYPENTFVIDYYNATHKLYRSKQTTLGHKLTETDYWEVVDLYQGEYDATVTYTQYQFVSSNDNLYMCLQECIGQSVTDTTYFQKYARTKTQANRYRGIENPFGEHWNILDGVYIRISANVDNGGDGTSKIYVCADTDKITDSSTTAYETYEYIGDYFRGNGYYIKDINFNEDGGFIIKEGGGSYNTYYCDLSWTSVPSTGEAFRALFAGGVAYNGSARGLACVSSNPSPSDRDLASSARLCFIPKE